MTRSKRESRRARATTAFRSRRAPADASRPIDLWVLRLTVVLAYTFMAGMVVSILFPDLGLSDGLAAVLLGAVELFLLLRAYIAFRVRSTIEGVMFVIIFLIVLVALLA